VTPIWYPDNSYTAPDAVSETLQAATNNASSCLSTYSAWTTLVAYANMGQVPTNCQGAAYDTMVSWMNTAAHLADVPLRTLEYNLIEHIGNELALYVYDPQSVVAFDFGNWIQGSTVNTNPVYGGGGVQLWYQWGYVSDYFNTTFTATGLPAGTNWTVTLAGQAITANTATISFNALLNGSYPYSISPVAGYLSSPSSGTVTVAGADVPVAIGFTATVGPSYTIQFSETGLHLPTQWSVVLNAVLGGGQTLHGNTSILWANLTGGLWDYTPGGVTGYTTPAAGQINVTANATVSLVYAGLSGNGKFPVSFTETGLPGTGTWSVSINGSLIPAGSGTLTVSLANGTYSWGVATLPSGYAASPSGGTVTVQGSAIGVAVGITATGTGTGQTTNNVPWNSLSTLAWILIGVLALLVVIFLALAIMAGRRPPSSPPESWSSSSTTTSTDGGSTTTNTKGGNP